MVVTPLSCSLAFSELTSLAVGGGSSGGFFLAAFSRRCSMGHGSESVHQAQHGKPRSSVSVAGHPGRPCFATH